MTTCPIPTDSAEVRTASISDEEWADAADAHERFKAVLGTEPRAKARYEALRAAIELGALVRQVRG